MWLEAPPSIRTGSVVATRLEDFEDRTFEAVAAGFQQTSDIVAKKPDGTITSGARLFVLAGDEADLEDDEGTALFEVLMLVYARSSLPVVHRDT